MDDGAIARIIGSIIAGLFGFTAKMIEIQYRKKNENLHKNPPEKDADADGVVTPAEADAYDKAIEETSKKKEKFSFIQKNLRILSTLGFIVAGVIIGMIIVTFAMPAGKKGEDLPVSDAPSVTTAAIKADEYDPEKYVNSVALLTDKGDEFGFGDVFAITYKDKLYFVTSFNAIAHLYNSVGEDGFYINFKTQNDIFSKDLTLVGYSPLYNVAILTPNSIPEVKGFVLAETAPKLSSEITVIGTSVEEYAKLNTARTGRIISTTHIDMVSRQSLYLTDAALVGNEASPVFAEDMITVVGMTNGEKDGNDSIIIPALTIKTVLDEMLKPDSAITPFPADEFPEKFNYAASDNYMYGEHIKVGELNLNFYKLEDIRQIQNFTDEEAEAGIRRLTAEYKESGGFLSDSITNTTLITAADEGSHYSYLTEDGEPDYSLAHFSYYEGQAAIKSPEGNLYFELGEDRFLYSADENSNGLFATSETVGFYDGGEEYSFTLDNPGGAMPENLDLDVNQNGFYLTDNNTGAIAYITINGEFGVKHDSLWGEKTDGDKISMGKDSGDKDDLTVKIEKTDEKSFLFTVGYSALEEHARGAIEVTNNMVGNLSLYSEDKTIEMQPWVSLSYYDGTKNVRAIYTEEDGLLKAGNDSGKIIIMDANHYYITRAEGFTPVGDPFPYLLDRNDIPDTGGE
ncbi:MAG: hypothetical protein LBL98_02205 [Ruminococcus sp.]|jgi:hypothetical protein|nr:hypothetical protein [Ruminococcus sp.]